MGNGTIGRDLAAKVLMSSGLEENPAKTAATVHLAATADTEGWINRLAQARAAASVFTF